MEFLLNKKLEVIDSVDNDGVNAWLGSANMNIALLLLAHGIEEFKPSDKTQGQWLQLLELKTEDEFHLLRGQVNDFGMNLVNIEVSKDTRLNNIPIELKLHMAIISLHDTYLNIVQAFLRDENSLKLLKQRCAREILKEHYSGFSKNYSPEIDYIEELKQVINSSHN